MVMGVMLGKELGAASGMVLGGLFVSKGRGAIDPRRFVVLTVCRVVLLSVMLTAHPLQGLAPSSWTP